VERMGYERGVYMVSGGRPDAMRPLGRPRRRWKNNVRQESMGRTGFAWLRVQWRAFVSTVMKLRVP
jgi:hypothetical protein